MTETYIVVLILATVGLTAIDLALVARQNARLKAFLQEAKLYGAFLEWQAIKNKVSLSQSHKRERL